MHVAQLLTSVSFSMMTYGLLVFVGFYYAAVWFLMLRPPALQQFNAIDKPPDRLSPGAISYLSKRTVKRDSAAFSASLINMAVGNYITIHEYQTDIKRDVPDVGKFAGIFAIMENIFQIDKTGYRLQKTAQSGQSLAPEETLIAEELIDVKKDLRMSSVICDIDRYWLIGYERCLARTYKKIYFKPKLDFVWLGGLVSILALITSYYSSLLIVTIPVLTGLHFFVFKMPPAPNDAGQMLLKDIEGFRLYLCGDSATKNKSYMRFPPENLQKFDQLLPYAVGLGIADKWAAQCEAALATDAAFVGPSWYYAINAGPGRLVSFVDGLLGGFVSVVRRTSYKVYQRRNKDDRMITNLAVR